MAHTAYSFTQQIKGVDGLRLYKMIIRRALRTLSLAPSSVPILTITSSSASPAVAAGDRGKTSPTVHMAPCWKTGNINFLARLSETVNCSRWPVIVICRIKERTPKPPQQKEKTKQVFVVVNVTYSMSASIFRTLETSTNKCSRRR